MISHDLNCDFEEEELDELCMTIGWNQEQLESRTDLGSTQIKLSMKQTYALRASMLLLLRGIQALTKQALRRDALVGIQPLGKGLSWYTKASYTLVNMF